MRRIAYLVVCLLGLGFISSASAVPIPPLNIADFRNPEWTPPSGATSMAVGDITASAYAFFFVIFPTGLNQSSDGFGAGYLAEPDEINPLQWITVDFMIGQRIDFAWVANLFPDEITVCVRRTRRQCNEYEFLDEIGAYSADGGAQVIFTAADADGNLRLDLGSEIIESITFYVPAVDPIQQSKHSDFSLVGFSVPEPTALALTGLGLAGIGYKRGRSKKSAK